MAKYAKAARNHECIRTPTLQFTSCSKPGSCNITSSIRQLRDAAQLSSKTHHRIQSPGTMFIPYCLNLSTVRRITTNQCASISTMKSRKLSPTLVTNILERKHQRMPKRPSTDARTPCLPLTVSLTLARTHSLTLLTALHGAEPM